MKPLDPRLLRYAATTRWLMLGAVVVGAAAAVATIGYATTLAHLISAALRHGQPRDALVASLTALGVWVLLRVVLAWCAEYFPRRSAVRLTSELRQALLQRVSRDDRGTAVRRSPSNIINLATVGTAGLEEYAARFLPQVVIAAIVPLGVVAYVGWLDLTSGLIVLVTLPLIPLFMVLIGRFTQVQTQRQYRLLETLAHRFTDVVTGLATLKAYGREHAQAELIDRTDRQHKRATMKTLRIAFLSALALELLATLSVALVAVTIGLRLAQGGVGLEPALTVLLVAPEAYLALRAVGTHFHASIDGLTAAERIFAILEEPVPAAGAAQAPRSAPALSLSGAVVQYPDERGAVTLPDLSVPAGHTVLLRGASGSGKSTALNVLAGLIAPVRGQALVDGSPLSEIDRSQWLRAVAYVGQSPYIIAGSIADNLRILRPAASEADLSEAVRTAGLDEVIAQQPHGLATVLSEGAPEWSQGQRQRLAIARAVVADTPVVLLDEPTSALDEDTERTVLSRLAAALNGRTVVLASHRAAAAAYADHVVELDAVTA